MRKSTSYPAFYYLNKKNVDLSEDSRVNFGVHVNKGIQDIKLEELWSLSWSKNGIKGTGVDSVLRNMPRNMSFLANTTTTHLNDRYPMDKELKTRMIHAICYTCSGRNLSNDPIYRYYKNFQELYEHCINLHSQEVSKHSYVNILVTETEWYLIKATKKPPTFVLIRREIVDKHLNTKLRIVNKRESSILHYK